MSQLIPAIAALSPALPLLALAHLMRSQGGRHTAGIVRPHAPYANPYDGRTRAAIRHYASHTREAGLSTGAAA